MTNLILSELLIYPIKSAAGISVKAASLTPRGLEHDRRFMVVDPKGHFMTQRRFPKMALISAHVATSATSVAKPIGLSITAPGMSELGVMLTQQPEDAQQNVEVEVWGDRMIAQSCGSDAAAWFSQYLGIPCQLVHMPNATQRPTDHGKFGPNEIVSFADAYPYLLLTEASLTGLNQKLAAKQASPVPMNRFRPNLVISGELAPHAEDSWKRIRIGDAIFSVAKPCARCSIPNVDQAKGDRTQEPSRTLATYRAWDRGIWFGQNLIQENPSEGELKVGDEVDVLA